MPTNTFTSPLCIARMVRTVSRPCARGGSIPQASPRRSRKASVGRWSMPQVRLPCTLLCPRTGEGPAPSRPRLPRSSSRLTISRTVSTPCSCWVSPRHQLTMERSASRYTRVASRMSARLRPDWVSISSHGVAAQTVRYSAKPAVWRSMNSWSSALGSVADCSRMALAMPRSRAMSPPMRGCRFRVLVRVGLNRAMSTKSCGTMVRVPAASTRGLTCTIRAPRRWASASAVSIRGALEAAFTPRMNSASADSQSLRSTVPLPVPREAVRARPLAS